MTSLSALPKVVLYWVWHGQPCVLARGLDMSSCSIRQLSAVQCQSCSTASTQLHCIGYLGTPVRPGCCQAPRHPQPGFVGRQQPATESCKLAQIDERMEMIAGMRPKGEKARAIKVTVFKRWHQSQQLELRPGVSIAPCLSILPSMQAAGRLSVSCCLTVL